MHVTDQRAKGRPERQEQDTADTQAKITPYRDGPYLVRGPFSIVDQNGNEIEVKRRVIALCRCGRSQTRPFCDGTHKAIGFRAESGLPAPAPSPADLEP
ncbi:MAG TPA: CDGSH iron-sulfur domain-containing protein [Solirubrobacterales bacterium]|nr:CDGSH iron-sulfur domain-containing protein [Solirubrobacterales bacterium]